MDGRKDWSLGAGVKLVKYDDNTCVKHGGRGRGGWGRSLGILVVHAMSHRGAGRRDGGGRGRRLMEALGGYKDVLNSFWFLISFSATNVNIIERCAKFKHHR